MSTPDGNIFIQNHPIYWFEDGSLILDVEIQRFKVHHTLLSRHSRFFSPKAEINGGTDGKPQGGTHNASSSPIDRPLQKHIVLEAERQIKATDVEALMQHLYHDVPLNKDAPVQHILSLLRVSAPAQLDFPNIHTATRQIFEDMFPKDPEGFTHTHPLHDALPVATELKLSSVRKAILYSLVTTTDFDVSGSNSGEVDTQAKADPAASTVDETNVIPHAASPSPQSNTPTKVQVLSPADAETCMALMNRLITHFTPILFTPAATPHMACTDVFAETWMPLVIQPAIADDGVYKPLETLQRMKEIDWAKHGLCESCVVEKREEWTEEQRTVWNLMDTWLESPSE
ncbi:hypothetical protein CVT26_002640 [Gymnopilus dilepis]|uniref:Uncharacterized protein n=1 Tax=Gymnopilus dilepis TaxID=231916 RepID=A0A409VCK5_9AGAR|nr:hypothetical protein CVT26_002640 [Gymnopilus dilepis]